MKLKNEAPREDPSLREVVTRLQKICLFEFWGLGDGVFLTGVLDDLRARDWQVTVVAKPATIVLLSPYFSKVEWIEFDPPWTKFTGKYRIWSWPWKALISLFLNLRARSFDVVMSVRADPRDHVLMWLSRARRRLGIPRSGSQVLLTDSLELRAGEHKVETWSRLAAMLYGSANRLLSPALPGACPERCSLENQTVLIHVGARIPVRRWPTLYWRELIERMRDQFDYRIELIFDLDGSGSELTPYVDSVHSHLSLHELVLKICGASVFLCNDSGPGHIAAALNVPVFAIFGPTDPDVFRPFGNQHHVCIRDICPHRPCFDYCKFAEPLCLTKLVPSEVFSELKNFLEHHKTR